MRAAWIIGAVGFVSGLPARSTAAEDAYFVIVVGAQPHGIKSARHAHSFATFIHLTSENRVEEFTISWLPQTETVRPLRPLPEVGRNFTLPETLRWVHENGLVIARWGPYQIEPDLWHRAVLQKERLDSGAILYKAFDGGARTERVSDCLHAITMAARGPGDTTPRLYVLPGDWGESGSYWIALRLRPWFIEPCRVDDWVMPCIGLDPDAFPRNGLDRNPTRNPVTRVIQAGFQYKLLPNRVDCDHGR